MKRFFAFMLAFLASVSLWPRTVHAQENWNEVEPVAKSIVRLERLAHEISAGVAVRIKERGLVSEEGYEEIALGTAQGLCRAIKCLRHSFFEGASQEEIEAQLVLVEMLAERVKSAGGRLGLYGMTRERLAALLNETDALKRYLGMP